ncbi:MAG: ROK family protein [Nocardioidaceae bacterium]
MPQEPRLSSWLRDSPGALLQLFRAYPDGLTRGEAVRLTGLSRTAVNQRLEVLLAARVLQPIGSSAGGVGRPADRFGVNPGRGVLLVADAGATGLRLALTDMLAAVVEESYRPIDITAGPAAVLASVGAGFTELLARHDRSPGDVLGIGIDVPGPVDHATGRVVHPPIMTGWHDFDIPAHLRAAYDCPVIVEKDVNAMAFGEQRIAHPDTGELIFVKLGTGIGTGLVIGGEIYRGADGAAGDVGHIPLSNADDDAEVPTCRCGNLGCIEAYAGGWALVRDLEELGHDVSSVDDVVRLTLDRHPDAVRLVRSAATIVGTAVSDLVNIMNPRVIVLGGQLAAVEDLLFAGIREVVYRRSLPLATRELSILPTHLNAGAGIHGLARLALDEVHSIARVNAMLGD